VVRATLIIVQRNGVLGGVYCGKSNNMYISILLRFVWSLFCSKQQYI